VPAALSHDIALATASNADSLGRRVDVNAEKILMQLKINKFVDIFADDWTTGSRRFSEAS
jgi:hypothetical protein